MNELINLESSVTYKVAEIKFPGYEEMKQYALTLADRIAQVEVTEENVKAVKKDLAAVRKMVAELNNCRKLVKAEILRDYNIFESQIKEIDVIITEAEGAITDQLNQIEFNRMKQKSEEIRNVWDKRIGQYTLSEYGDFFNRWLEPRYLNKTTSMKVIETEMVAWLESKQRDLDVLATMDTEYFVEYMESLDLTGAIQRVNRKNEIRSMVTDVDESEVTAMFVITGEKDIKFTESLLKENHIEYRRTK